MLTAFSLRLNYWRCGVGNFDFHRHCLLLSDKICYRTQGRGLFYAWVVGETESEAGYAAVFGPLHTRTNSIPNAVRE